jgi:RNA polymerase-binding transcription factor DksA
MVRSDGNRLVFTTPTPSGKAPAGVFVIAYPSGVFVFQGLRGARAGADAAQFDRLFGSRGVKPAACAAASRAACSAMICARFSSPVPIAHLLLPCVVPARRRLGGPSDTIPGQSRHRHFFGVFGRARAQLASNLLSEAIMDAQTLDTFRRKLLLRADTSSRLDPMAEAEALALTRAQASLDRIARGTFGDCVICHGAIETERLRAMPDVERCGGCTH